MLSGSWFSAPARRRTTVRWVTIAGALLFLLATLSACSNSAVAPGDPAGTSTSTAQHLIGLQPGDITQESSDKAQVDEPYAYQLAGWVDQNRIAINFVWLLVDRLPGHVHAGGLRARGDRLHAGQERPPHDVHELHDLWHRHHRVLPGGLRLRLRWPALCRWRQPGHDRSPRLDAHGVARRPHLGPAGHDRLHAVGQRL